jgi:hypothetical protein
MSENNFMDVCYHGHPLGTCPICLDEPEDLVWGDSRKLALPIHIPEMVVETTVRVAETPSGSKALHIVQRVTSPGVQFSHPHEITFTDVESVDYLIARLQEAKELL